MPGFREYSLLGAVLNDWTVVDRSPGGHTDVLWLLKCNACEKTVTALSSQVKKKSVRPCPCHGKPHPLANLARRAEVVEMRARGLSLRTIAKQFGISRQRVHQLSVKYPRPGHAEMPEKVPEKEAV